LARDRWIMAGLVTLGFFTVIAGVLSGRSTIDYVLGRDAREAALAWSEKIDAQLRSPQSDAADSAAPDIQVLNAAALDELASGAQEAITLPARPSFSGDGFALIDGFNRLTRGWFLSNLDEKSSEFVSQMDGFAVMTPTGQTLAVGGGLSPDALSDILESGAGTALANAVRDDTVELADLSGQDDLRMAFVPVTQDGKISRVYAFAVDRTAAASLTSMALTVATLTTTLLIVMGFSVPAAIASRRSVNAGTPKTGSTSWPCTIPSPGCPIGCNSGSILTVRSRAPSATATLSRCSVSTSTASSK
jgi:hypothetical protein